MPAKKKEEAPIGLGKGTKVENLTVINAESAQKPILEFAGERGIALAFVRSLDWCPFCKKQARLLNELQADIAMTGWELAVISYDPPAVLADFKAKNEINSQLLSDGGSKVIDAFNLRNHNVKPGGRSVGVPHPAIVFVDKDGTINSTLRQPGYQKRPSAEEVLAHAKSL